MFSLLVALLLLTNVNSSFSQINGTINNINNSGYYHLQYALEDLLLTGEHKHFVCKEFSKLYKAIYKLSYSKMPFKSFELQEFENYMVPLVQHNSMYCACSYHTPISMVSDDRKCVIYLHVLSQFDGVTPDSINEYYVKRFLARKVKCNIETDKPTLSAITDNEVSIISSHYLNSYTDYKWVKQCGADVVFTALFPNRETVGAYMNGEYVQLHPEYERFYTVFFYKKGHLPIQMQLFVDADAVLEDYLLPISRSFHL